LDLVRILEAASASLKTNGAAINFASTGNRVAFPQARGADAVALAAS